MKAIMMSIRPEWVEKILNGEKTIEIRKTIPKCELPAKVYIYETKGKGMFVNCGKQRQKIGGKVVAEFTLKRVTYLGNVATDEWKYLTGSSHEWKKQLVKRACLTESEMLAYRGEYAWHIDDLKIYDKPKELSDFSQPFAKECRMCISYTRKHICGAGIAHKCLVLTRPPQSWCYVEEAN